MRRFLPVIAILGAIFLSVALSGCGGSTGTPVEITLYSEAGLDGDAYKTHTDPVIYNSHADRAYINAGHEAALGPPDYHVSIRCFVSFNILSIPAGATIQTATLRIYKMAGNGDESAYTVLGNLLLDHVSYTAFSSDLYELAALETLAAPFATSSAANGTWKELAVTAQVQDDLAESREHSQFRLRFAKEIPDDNGDYNSYYENWAPAESVGERPELVITYLP